MTDIVIAKGAFPRFTSCTICGGQGDNPELTGRIQGGILDGGKVCDTCLRSPEKIPETLEWLATMDDKHAKTLRTAASEIWKCAP